MAITLICVAGARPNFVKIASIMRELAREPLFRPVLVHTGQHYTDDLSKVFFEDLAIPRPDIELDVGSGSHAHQTAEIMKRFEPVVQELQPHGVLVVGDVNSTVACALVTSKFHRDEPFPFRTEERTRPVMIHVEAGLRSHDRNMPEEINRILTDRVSDLLFVSDPSGVDNLRDEGAAEEDIHFVGNVMIDTLLAARDKAMESDVLARLSLEERSYGLVTLHRPSNVDEPEALRDRLQTLDDIAHDVRLVFPVHPRTRHVMDTSGIELDGDRWLVTDPFGYLDFVKLMASARVVLTDSGGIQEETTILGVPCVTLRENTERPVTLSEGSNLLAGITRDGIMSAWDRARDMQATSRVPRLWDGRTAERITAVLRSCWERPGEAKPGRPW